MGSPKESKCICPNCGADVKIPAPILHDAEKWQHRLKVEAERKAQMRKKDKMYCRTKQDKKSK